MTDHDTMKCKVCRSLKFFLRAALLFGAFAFYIPAATTLGLAMGSLFFAAIYEVK